jgi:hypothetical protein
VVSFDETGFASPPYEQDVVLRLVQADVVR